MALDFSLFADDMVLEILGHLPALDIVRYRRVCRRVYLASKERCIWVNVFARTKCALPPVDLNATTTQELEKMVVRAEIMDAKWTGTRRPAPQFYQSPLPRGRSFFVGSMGRCAVLAHQTAGETRYAWYQTRNLEDPIFEYHIPSPLLQNPVCHVELGTNILHLAYIPQKPAAQQQFLKIVRFRLSEEGQVLKSSEHDIQLPLPLQNPTAPWASFDLNIGNGYVVLYHHTFSSLVALRLFHINTGKCTVLPTRDDYTGNDSPSSQLKPIITSSHLVLVLDGKGLTFFELPTQATLSGAHSIGPVRKTHCTVLPHRFSEVHLFARSTTSFVVVGLGPSAQEQCVRIHLLTLDLCRYSSECLIRESFVYEVTGELVKFALPPPSLLSESALGLLIARVTTPTRDFRGRRIPRRERSHTYYLAARVAFGSDSVAANISLTELAMPADIEDRRVLYRSFDPYTGQMFLEDLRTFSSSQLVIGDYLCSVE